MTKAKLDLLGKVFAAEICGSLPFQTRSKLAPALVEEGLLAIDERRMGTGPFAVSVRGYELTHAGRLAYCSSCA